MKYWEIDSYKYLLAEDVEVMIDHPFWNPMIFINDFIQFNKNILTIKKYYAWDGASGPAIDTKNFMTPSLIHDALYQIIREGGFENFDKKKARKEADKILHAYCKTCGMGKIRAWYVYRAVRMFGSLWNKKTHKKEMIEV